jgi:hypothetical protein
MERRRKPKDEGEDQIHFEEDLYKALRLEGLLLPETEEEVSVAEARGLTDAPPLELRDSHAVLKRVKARRPRTRPGGRTASAEIEDNLARAAREGGRIPPDVERVMQLDRDAAERKKYGNEG